ncbi:hypothetical protein ACFFU8_08885 [Chromobacterium piscinae]|uniref:hypothetical protein n=1 Tax=Chromobacterium piscinae TaxID=686831 RepID=UPI001E631FBF|nr:hypothetical protein [Chromobacterium piscinae]MCD5327981.1 hypothetical protein [Chromobacterium piscinae]
MLLNTLLDRKAAGPIFTSSFVIQGQGRDVSFDAARLGLSGHYFIDDEVWKDAVEWTGRDSAEHGVDLDSLTRLQDLLLQLRRAARGAGTTTVYFSHMRVPRSGRSSHAERIRLVANYIGTPHGQALQIHFLSE